MKKQFACGCCFDVIDNHISYNPNIEQLPLECCDTWNLIGEGNTKGVFQLESQLGRSMAERVKPRNIEELSDLIAIIRPGCMEAIVDDKSLTQHYIDRKHGIDPVEYFHDALKPILSSTHGILVYQEQALLIARDIGGFNLQEADILRKAIGKKNVGLMTQLRQQFISKAKAKGTVTSDQAKEIFGWIEKSQRYSFNKSHSIAYATLAAWTTYLKFKHPKEFFLSLLKMTQFEPAPHEEIAKISTELPYFGIELLPPDLGRSHMDFKIEGDNIRYGLNSIKGVSQKTLQALKDFRESETPTKYDIFISAKQAGINIGVLSALVQAGALNAYKTKRSRLVLEAQSFNLLTDRE